MQRALPPLPLLAGALAALLATGCGGDTAAGGAGAAASSVPRNVVLICWDTVRADHLGAYGYTERPTTPHLDALAARSTVFADASAAAGWTKPSVPSFLTGTLPAEHGVYEGSAGFDLGKTTDVLPEDALTLAEVFAARGYRTGAFIKNAQLRPGNGFEQGFDTYVDEVGDARDVRWAGLDWLDSLEGDAPFFLYLHKLDAHWPYAIPDEAVARFVELERAREFQGDAFEALMDAVHDGERRLSEAERADLLAVYDGALRYLDEQLGALLEGLELRGLADDTVVVLVSDHGEEFGEHGRIGHGHGLYEALLEVPFVVHVPGRAPQRIEHPVSLLDLFPTLLGIFGEDVPEHVLGVDRLAQPEADRPIVSEHKAPDRYLQAVRQPSTDEKLVREARSLEVDAGPRYPVRIGMRLEAELEPDGDGYHVTELDADDGDHDDPVELKGMVRDLDELGFHLAGVPVRLAADTELKWGDDVEDQELREGRGVKVEGRFEDGTLLAEEIKLYPAAAEIGLELRGPVLAVDVRDAEGTLDLGGLRVRVDGWTDLDLPGADSKPRMSREAVARFHELGAAAAADEGYTLAAWAYDLAADPAEQQRREVDPLEGGSLSTLLDELGRVLSVHRTFTSADRIHLTPEAIEALQAIGYAR